MTNLDGHRAVTDSP